MRRLAWPAVLAVVTAFAVSATAPAADPAGTWLLTINPRGSTVDSNYCILKVEKTGNGLSASVVAVPTPPKVAGGFTPPPVVVKSAAAKGDRVAVVFTNGQTFTGVLGKADDAILGAFGTEAFMSRAKLTRTTETEIKTGFTAGKAIPQVTEAAKVATAANLLRFKAQSEKDADKKKELQAQAVAAAKEADEKLPGLYREAAKATADMPAGIDSALTLIAFGAKAKLTAAEAKGLMATIAKQAAPYGPDYAQLVTVQAAEGLAGLKGLGAVAADALRPVAKAFTADTPAAAQVKVLTALKTALAGTDGDELKQIEGRLAKLESKLDEEYHATVPPFKPAPFAGRKDKDANRAVVMELFTGAQCPPCVAADVAFDALGKSHAKTDLVLIQYHMHIPGPDPLTNRDTIARWDYYRERFPTDIRGTPSTLFNGTPKAGGGGGMANAEKKYEAYAKIIDPLLEEKTGLKVTGRAVRTGDKIEIAVDYAGAPADGDYKLRMLLVEEEVKYVGGNKLRFHHAVVRAMPGGAAGVAVKSAAGKQTAQVSLATVRGELTKYLDDYAANTAPFPNSARPMEMKKVQVIALIQDDKTGEVLQAARFDVTGPGAASQ